VSLRIRFDSDFARLADALVDDLSRASHDPFVEHAVIVPSIGVGRWLQQRVASRQGIAARLRLDFPGRFLWRALRSVLPELPEQSPFDPQVARWAILSLFDALPAGDACLALARRLDGSAPSDRLALAEAVAAQFERYLAWRRDWLLRWQQGLWAQADAPLDAHEAWQRWLWRALVERLPGVSRAHPYDLFEATLRDQPQRVRDALGGQRIAVLGWVGLSPEQTRLLARLSEVVPVGLYAPDPCRELWSDLVDRKARARLLAERPDVAWLYESEPEVLGSWGRAQRDQVAQLLALEEAAGVQAEAPHRDLPHPLDPLVAANEDELPAVLESPDLPRPDRLQALRAAILLRSDRPWLALDGARADLSLQVHATHGVVRQAEVLHDRLLECFASLPDLTPGDVAVFCPAIEDVADAIEAVFSGVPAERRIPVAVSGRAARVDPLLRAALELLELGEQQAPLSRVAQWLANPAVREALRLDEEEAGELVRAFEAAGARWGLDGRAGPQRHHWQAALERLLVGAALGAADEPAFGFDAGDADEESGLVGSFDVVGDVAPVAGLRRVGTQALERLMPMFEALDALRTPGRAAAPVARWCALARRLFERLFARAHSCADARVRLADAIASLQQGAQIAPEVEIDAPAFRRALSGELDRAAAAALPSGAVTVCQLGGLRGVPYRVVCLFGMDEGVFPRASARGEFDLTRRAPRFGDREQRLDDRAIFLDALLAAGERLIVTYCGSDPRDDTPRNPSTPIVELREYVNARLPEGALALAATVHPLHGFSPRAFARADEDADAADASFAQERIATAAALAMPLSRRREGVGPLVAWNPSAAVTAADEADGEPLAPQALSEALSDPARAFLRRRVGMRLVRERAAVDDIEPLWVDDARDRELVGRVARRLLGGADRRSLEAALRASPSMAAGAAGVAQAAQVMETAEGLVRRCRDAAEALEGPARCMVSSFNLGVRALVDAWLSHARWCVGESPAGARADATTVLVTPDRVVRIGIADPEAALRHAQGWARRIRSEPLPLFPRTLLAWYQSDGDAAVAQRELLGDDGGFTLAEVDRGWAAALHRDAVPELDAVIELGARVYVPIFDDCKIERTGRR